uniref:CD302 molecule n=1 Tax=Sander lucioperca TaxID=283035 RepID=A0A8C9ZT28_SANLU
MESLEKSHRYLSSICCVFVLCVQLQLGLTGDCPADGRTWVPFGDGCYYFVHGEEDTIKSYTFERAKTLCQGFELLTIQSAEENDFVIKYSPAVWKNNVNVWLGMYYDTNSDDMRWFGEQPVGFSNWEDIFSSSDLVPLDTCVALHSNTGKWENVSCLEQAENGVVCETNQKAEEAKPSKSIFELFLLFLYLFLCDFVFIVSDLPCIVTCSPQNPVHCCPLWSFSAWWLSWESQQSFGSCSISTTLAPLS